MAGDFFAELGLPRPDHALGIGGGTARRADRADAAGDRDRSSADERPDAVLVYGDTNSTLAGRPRGRDARRSRSPTSRPACGASTGGCRRRRTGSSTDHVSRWLFAPTPTAVANLAAEGIADGVVLVGDVMQDLAARVVGGGPRRRGRPRRRSPRRLGLALAPGELSLRDDPPSREPHGPTRSAPGPRSSAPRRGPDRPVVLALHPGTRAAARRGRRGAPGGRLRRRAAGLPLDARAPAPRRRRADRLGRGPARGGLARRAVPRPARDDGVGRGGRGLRRRDGRRRARCATGPRPSSSDWRRPESVGGPGPARVRPRSTSLRPGPRTRSSPRSRARAREGRHVRPERRPRRRARPEGGPLARRRRPRRDDHRDQPTGHPADRRAGAARRLRDRPGSAAALDTAGGAGSAPRRGSGRRIRHRGGAPGSRMDGLDWLAMWRFGNLGWARAAAREAGPADVYHGHDLTGLPAAVFAREMHGGTARVVYDSHELFVDLGRGRRPAVVGGRLARAPGAGVGRQGRCARHGQRRATRRSSARGSGRDEIVVVHNCPPRPVGELRALGRDPRRRRNPGRGADRALPRRPAAGPRRPSSSPRRCSSRAWRPAHLAFLGFGPSRGEVGGARRGAAVRRPDPRPRPGAAAGRRQLGRLGRRRRDADPGPQPELLPLDAEQDVRGVRRRACRSSPATFPGMRGIVAEDPERPAR